MGRIAGRTEKGNVTSDAREAYGDSQGKYPIFDQRSALSAIRLRNHSNSVSPDSVLRRAQAWGKENEDTRVLNAVERAREG